MEDRLGRLIGQLSLPEKIVCLSSEPSVPRLRIRGIGLPEEDNSDKEHSLRNAIDSALGQGILEENDLAELLKAFFMQDKPHFSEAGDILIQPFPLSSLITTGGEIDLSQWLPKSRDTRNFGAIGASLPQLHTPNGESAIYRHWELPNGNYRLNLTLGSEHESASTAISVKPRRLLLDPVETAAGQLKKRTVTVNVRHNELTLCCSGPRPRLRAVDIQAAHDAITVYLTGDSTVTNQEDEPFAGWGQMLGRFFTPDVAIANHAESGRAAVSFLDEKRLDVIRESMQAGDYLFVQFGHNDQKPEKEWYKEAFGGYKDALRIYLDTARQCGANPVLLTSTVRRFFSNKGTIIHSHGDYPDAVRQLALEEDVVLIDLYVLSKNFFEALGPEESKRAFVQYPAGTWPGQKWDLRDNTHFSEYGAYELARCVAEVIREGERELAQYVVQDLPPSQNF